MKQVSRKITLSGVKVVTGLIRSGIISLFVLSSAVVAQAADLGGRMPVKAVAPVAAMNWTGFYAGLGAGYHSGSLTQAGCVGLCPTDSGYKGAFLYGQLGADYQFANNIVLGVFVAGPLTQINRSVDIGFGINFDVRPKYLINVNARLGYAFDNILPYVFAGVATARISVNPPFGGATVSNNYTGPVVGVGLEYAFARNWSLDLKYSYVSLPNRTYNFGGGPEDFGERSHNFIAAVNFRF